MNDITNQDMTDAGEPAAERITRALVAQLQTMAKASGYWDDVHVAREEPADSAPPMKHANISVLWESEDKDEEVPNGYEQIRVKHAIVCDVSVGEDLTTPIDTLMHRIKADVKRCLRANPSLNGLAFDTIMLGALNLDPDPNMRFGRVIVIAETVYRTLEDDPYQISTES